MKFIVFLGIIIILILSPIPYGSVPKYSHSLLKIFSFLLFSLSLFDSEEREHKKFPKFFCILIIILFLFLLFQIIPLPLDFLRILSPQKYLLYQSYCQIENITGSFIPISIVPYLTLGKFVEYLSYLLLGIVIFKTISRKEEIKWVSWVLIGMGLFQAFSGLLQALAGSEKLLFLKKKYVFDVVSGTFVNRNHFAGLLEMVIPVSIGYLILASIYPQRKPYGWREKLLYFVEERIQKVILYLLIVVIMGLGLIFSRSRTGIIDFIVSIFLIIFLFSWQRTRKGYRRLLLFILLSIIFSSILIGITPVLKRFTYEAIISEMRPVIWKGAWLAFKDFIMTGTGAGTFQYIYPLYAQHSINAIAEHAHSDYLEFLVELGIFGFSILFTLLFGLWLYTLLKWRERNNPFVKGAGLGYIVGAFTIFMHSITDFNLHVPSNIVYFITLLIVGFKIVHLESEKI